MMKGTFILFNLLWSVAVLSTPCPKKGSADITKQEKAVNELNKVAKELDDVMTDEEIAKELAKRGCHLAVNGTEGLKEIRKNLVGDKKFSGTAMVFCDSLSDDSSQNIRNVQFDSVAYKKLKVKLARACIQKSSQDKFEKEYYPKVANNLNPLIPVMTKFFAKELNCKDGDTKYVEGNIYLSIFKRKLYKIADYLIKTIESELDGQTITLKDITTKENRNYLKEELCFQLTSSKSNQEREKIKKYLNKFYEKDTCQ